MLDGELTPLIFYILHFITEMFSECLTVLKWQSKRKHNSLYKVAQLVAYVTVSGVVKKAHSSTFKWPI